MLIRRISMLEVGGLSGMIAGLVMMMKDIWVDGMGWDGIMELQGFACGRRV